MLLPKLETLELKSVTGFGSMELPEMTNLTKYKIEFSRLSTVEITHLCSVVTKMPKLASLEISGLNRNQTLKLACEAIIAAASQKKDVVVSKHDRDYSKLKIEGQNDEQYGILNLMISENNEKTYFESLKEFVQKKVQSHRAFIFEDEKEKTKYLKK